MRKTTQEKRKKFVKTTEELFYKRGYKDTSIKDICEALETTTGSFYFMFDSKEGILEEIVKEYYEGFLDKIDETLEAGKNLKEKIISKNNRSYGACHYDDTESPKPILTTFFLFVFKSRPS